MKIEIEDRSGFCFGVENAISMAEESLKAGEKIYCLGHIVHNELEVERLESLGLRTINYSQFGNLKNCKVLIRAHGEPPETYYIAKENNIEIIEATCPIVKRLQQRVKDESDKAIANSSQLVLYGKEGHAEVRGLLGQASNNAILVNNHDDITKIDFNRPVTIFSQTTRSRKKYTEIILHIREIFAEKGHNPDNMVKVKNSICSQVANREPQLVKFAGKHDTIIFVSGKESSNGRMLFNVCKSVNDSSYFISDISEIDPVWLEGKKSIGICGATSTPKWLISDVYNNLREMTS